MKMTAYPRILPLLLACTASSQAATITAFSSGTNNSNSGVANATLIRIGAQDSNNSAGITMSYFTGFTTFDLSTTGFTLAQLQAATTTYSIEFDLTEFAATGGAPDTLTIDFVGLYSSGTHNATNVNGGSSPYTAGWVGAPVVNNIRTGAATVGANQQTTAVNLNMAGLDLATNEFAVFRYSFGAGLSSNGLNRQWDIASGTPALTVTVIPEPSTLVLWGLGCLGLLLRRRRN